MDRTDDMRRLWTVALALGLAGISRAPAEAAAARCVDIRAPVYFDRGSADLNSGAIRVLQAQVARAKRCRIDAVTLVGRGDAPPKGNDDTALAMRRAEAVATWLDAAGVSRQLVRLVPKPAQAPPRAILERRATLHMHLSAQPRPG